MALKVHVWRRCHRIISVLVATQLLIWLMSGLYFNLVPYEYLKATTFLNKQTKENITLTPSNIPKINELLHRYPNTEHIEITVYGNKHYALLTHRIKRYQHQCQDQTLLDLDTLQETQIEESTARLIAYQSYKGSAEIKNVRQIQGQSSPWLKQCNLLWRIEFEDDYQTRAYIQVNNGLLVGHKNKYSIFSDWAFRLHFMDYQGKGGFNNVFIWLFAGLALLLCISGFINFYHNYKKGRYTKSRP